MEIVGKIVVLLKNEDRVFITEETQLPLDCIAGNVPSGCSMWRVKKYDEYDGVIVLQAERGASRGMIDFHISSETNSSVFNFLHIKRLVLEDYRNVHSLNAFNRSAYNADKEQMQIHEKIFSEPIAQFTFKDGKACFIVSWNELDYHKEVEVDNPFLRQEHEAIKSYFEQFFDGGHFKVKITVGKKVGKVVYEKAFSEDIDHISDQLIRKIEYASTGNGGGEPNDNAIHVDKVQEQESTPVIEDVETLLSFLADNPSKHFNHLTYLSKLQEGKDFRLRTTSEPISFLFSFRTDSGFYMVWESHDTEEATYIWRFPLSNTAESEQHILNTENLLKDLRNSQKREYRKSRKNDLDFHVIEHDYQKEDHGFHGWKTAVEKYIHSIYP